MSHYVSQCFGSKLFWSKIWPYCYQRPHEYVHADSAGLQNLTVTVPLWCTTWHVDPAINDGLWQRLCEQTRTGLLRHPPSAGGKSAWADYDGNNL